MLCDSVSLFLLSAITSNKEICADDYQQSLERHWSPKVLVNLVSPLAGWGNLIWFSISKGTTHKLINGVDGIATASQGLHVLHTQQLPLIEIGGKKRPIDICCLCFVMPEVDKLCSLCLCSDVQLSLWLCFDKLHQRKEAWDICTFGKWGIKSWE